ncbi:hypothetical protein MPNT_120029 [Candidatus Methylacidithermus pantelleriae]|uniref:Transposase n=1 Tax=Candidatus Methylacidithermus pantelleriae TaxID=2744239 RepID=A0A8J2BI62_9BACT|nr:hypothetical protein MPNT_120029 [Candidatus Methylacidithermus pantelleriae]
MQSRSIPVVDPNQLTDDIVRALREKIVSLCARLYGKRSTGNGGRRRSEAFMRKIFNFHIRDTFDADTGRGFSSPRPIRRSTGRLEQSFGAGCGLVFR